MPLRYPLPPPAPRLKTSQQWRAELEQQKRELCMSGDNAATKRWLKRKRQELQAQQFDFGALF